MSQLSQLSLKKTDDDCRRGPVSRVVVVLLVWRVQLFSERNIDNPPSCRGVVGGVVVGGECRQYRFVTTTPSEETIVAWQRRQAAEKAGVKVRYCGVTRFFFLSVYEGGACLLVNNPPPRRSCSCSCGSWLWCVRRQHLSSSLEHRFPAAGQWCSSGSPTSDAAACRFGTLFFGHACQPRRPAHGEL